MIKTTLGVKGSQVQILSSRRSMEARLIMAKCLIRRAFVCQWVDLALIHYGDRLWTICGPRKNFGKLDRP